MDRDPRPGHPQDQLAPTSSAAPSSPSGPSRPPPACGSTTTSRSTCSASSTWSTRSAASRSARPSPINDDKTKLSPDGRHPQPRRRAGARPTPAPAPPPRSDLDRIDRQQQVISAMLQQALSGGTLTNPVKLSAAGQLEPAHPHRRQRTGRRTCSAWPPSSATSSTRRRDVRRPCRSPTSTSTTPTGESAVLWDKHGRRRDVPPHRQRPRTSPSPRQSRRRRPSPRPPASADPDAEPARPLSVPPNRIQIGSSTAPCRRGLGARTRDALLAAGFWSPQTGRRHRPPRLHRHLRPLRRPSREDSAKTVAAAFPGAELLPGRRRGQSEVIIGTKNNKVEKVTVPTSTPDPVGGGDPGGPHRDPEHLQAALEIAVRIGEGLVDCRIRASSG